MGEDDSGYVHETVNHSETFKDPETGACTNTIEGKWFAMKDDMPRRGRGKEKYLGVNLLFKIWKDQNCMNLFEAVLEGLRDVAWDEEEEVEEEEMAEEMAVPHPSIDAVGSHVASHPQGGPPSDGAVASHPQGGTSRGFVAASNPLPPSAATANQRSVAVVNAESIEADATVERLRAQLEEAIKCADALRIELEGLNQTTAATLPPPRSAITTTAQRHTVRFEDEAAMATTTAQRRSVHFEDDQMNTTPPRSMIQPLTLPTQSESVMSEPSIGSTEEEEFAVSVQASSAPQRGADEDDSVDMADQDDSINMADDEILLT